jgi:hypothetical protein
VGMAAAAWVTVVTGTWIVYPWYRAKPPAEASTLAYPQADLQGDSALLAWHDFGMEWKEHVAWLAPFLATAVAFVVLCEASAGLKDLLTFFEPAGSLSGKATVASLVWLASWLALHASLRTSTVELRPCLRIVSVLVAVAFVATFPPFFKLFATGH